MSSEIKKYGGKIAMIAAGVVVAIVVLRVLGGILRWVISIAIFLGLIYLALKLFNSIKK